MIDLTQHTALHSTAKFFYSRSGAKGIVIHTDTPESVAGMYPEEIPIFIACTVRGLLFGKRHSSDSLPNVKYIMARRLPQNS